MKIVFLVAKFELSSELASGVASLSLRYEGNGEVRYLISGQLIPLSSEDWIILVVIK